MTRPSADATTLPTELPLPQPRASQAGSAPGRSSDLRHQLRKKFKSLGRRELQLWSTALLILWLLTGGYLLPIVLGMMRDLRDLRLPDWEALQVLAGFVMLMVLFTLHVAQHRRTLNAAREMLLTQLIRAEAAEQESVLDPLTGVYNRRYLDRALVKEMRRAERLASCVSLLMIDLDDFKSVNTRFGHQAGDQFLREASALLEAVFRESDTLVRYGGDEFLVILPDTSRGAAERAVERLQERARDWNENRRSHGIRLGFSCGLAECRPGDSTDDALARADAEMYRNKAARRNLQSTSPHEDTHASQHAVVFPRP
ncbi:MAG TPA: GGDEF domain-containing protein [Terriglobales bacterium]|nr:GGDEF domain-containing protein [Terriglobales bacterium]